MKTRESIQQVAEAMQRSAEELRSLRGNMLGALGMFIAIVVTLLDKSIVSYWVIFAGIIFGGGVGAVATPLMALTISVFITCS